MQGALEKLQKVCQEQEAIIAQLRSALSLSEAQVQYLLKLIYGSKSEKFDPRQLELLLSGLQEHEEQDEQPGVEKKKPSPPRRQAPRKPRKPRLPEDLPTEEHVFLPEEVEADPDAFENIGEETTEELGVRPPEYFRRLYIRPKFVRKADRSQPPLIAKLPPRLIPGSYASPELLTDITVKKFGDHLPLYRQEQILKRYGIELSRKTMCDWVHQVAWWLKPIYNHIRDELRRGQYLQIDESPIRYCQAEGGGSSKGYVWVYHRPGAGVLFEWHTGRGAVCLNEMLEDFGGTVQSDGYAAYQSYARERAQHIADGAKKPEIVLAACWAHARRKFHEALEEYPVQAGWALRQIQLLYAIETRLRHAKAGPRYRSVLRSVESTPILARLEKMLKLKLDAYRPTTKLGKAIRYTLSLWPQLARFASDGQLEIDNNGVENAIRPSAIGKKNWLFFGAPSAGEHAAVIYTILENCKRLGIRPQEYLLDVLQRLPSTDPQQAVDLTPANWAEARLSKCA